MHFWSATPQFGRGGCGRRRPGTSGTLYIGGAGLNRNKRLGMSQNNPYALGSSLSHRPSSSLSAGASSSNSRFNQASGANNATDEESRTTPAAESRGSFYPTNATRSSREYPQEMDIGVPSSNAQRIIDSTANNNSEISSAEFQELSPISPSIENTDPKWIRTKRIGLSLFFLSFILLGIVAAKFIIEGPILIDTARKGKGNESTIYFFLTELIFVAFAITSFLTGIYCLRKQTNKYLLRQFNQHIHQTSSNPAAPNMTGADDSTFSSSTNLNYQSEIFFNDDDSDLQHQPGYHCHPPSLTPCLYHHSPTRGSGGGGRNHSNSNPAIVGHHLHNFIVYGQRQSRCPYLANQNQKPPSYDVALNLPIPANQNSTTSTNSAGQVSVFDSSITTTTTTNVNCTSIEIGDENKGTTIMNNNGTQKNDDSTIGVGDNSPVPKSETPPPEYKNAFEEFRFKI